MPKLFTTESNPIGYDLTLPDPYFPFEKNIIVDRAAKPGEHISIPGVSVINFEVLRPGDLFEASRPGFAKEELSDDRLRQIYETIAQGNKGFKYVEVIYGADYSKLKEAVLAALGMEEIQERFPGISLNNIQPYQAAFLASFVATRGVDYDYTLLAKNERFWTTYIDKIPEPERTRILNMKGNKEALTEYTTKKNERADSRTADEILVEGKGVCRHIAAVAAATFIAIKQAQLEETTSKSLNGSYFLYYDVNKGALAEGKSDANHAYNILVVTAHNYQDGGNEAIISVVDPTWGKDLDFDQTARRHASAATVIKKLGKDLGIVDPEKKAAAICEEGIKVKGRPSSFGPYFNDYLNLLRGTELGKRDTLTHSYALEDLLKRADPNQMPAFIETALRSEVTTEQLNLHPGFRRLYLKYVVPVYKEVLRYGIAKLPANTRELIEYDASWGLSDSDFDQLTEHMREPAYLNRLNALAQIYSEKETLSAKEKQTLSLAYLATVEAKRVSRLEPESVKAVHKLSQAAVKRLTTETPLDPKELIAETYLAACAPDATGRAKPLEYAVTGIYNGLRTRPTLLRRTFSSLIDGITAESYTTPDELEAAVYSVARHIDFQRGGEETQILADKITDRFQSRFSVPEAYIGSMLSDPATRQVYLNLFKTFLKVVDMEDVDFEYDDLTPSTIRAMERQLKKFNMEVDLDEETRDRIERIKKHTTIS